MSHPAEIGATVRRRRLQLGLTLEALAAASGVSAAMLSEVERQVKNPTVKLAYQIARALGCSLTELLEEESAPAPVVIRAAKRRALIDPETGVKRYALSLDLLRRGIELAWYVLPAGQSTGEMAANRAGILEHVTVASGKLELVLGGVVHHLAKGDGITYGPQATVEYKNPSRASCEFLMLADATRAF